MIVVTLRMIMLQKVQETKRLRIIVGTAFRINYNECMVNNVDRELLIDHQGNFVHYDFLKLHFI